MTVCLDVYVESNEPPLPYWEYYDRVADEILGSLDRVRETADTALRRLLYREKVLGAAFPFAIPHYEDNTHAARPQQEQPRASDPHLQLRPYLARYIPGPGRMIPLDPAREGPDPAPEDRDRTPYPPVVDLMLRVVHQQASGLRSVLLDPDWDRRLRSSWAANQDMHVERTYEHDWMESDGCYAELWGGPDRSPSARFTVPMPGDYGSDSDMYSEWNPPTEGDETPPPTGVFSEDSSDDEIPYGAWFPPPPDRTIADSSGSGGRGPGTSGARAFIRTLEPATGRGRDDAPRPVLCRDDKSHFVFRQTRPGSRTKKDRVDAREGDTTNRGEKKLHSATPDWRTQTVGARSWIWASTWPSNNVVWSAVSSSVRMLPPCFQKGPKTP